MKPYLRAFPAIFLVVLCVPEVFWAQTKTPRPDDTSTRAADGAGGTLIKKLPVTTEDDIAKLTVRKTNKPAETLVAKAVVGPDALGAAADPEKAELVTLRQEIKDKQRKLELLMKMFATDEQAFVRDPSAQTGTDDLQMKRRYEQEELRQEAAEIARLRARFEVMEKAVEQKTAPVTP